MTETVQFDDDDDDGGLMGCLGRWWWLAALILGILILALILNACLGGDDGDAATEVAATTTTEAPAPTTTEPEPEPEPETTTTAAPETTTTTAAPTTTEAPEPELQNLVAVAEAESPLVTGLLGPLGLAAALEADGPFTVFLPSDEGGLAFVEANPTVVDTLNADPVAAASILGYHVVPGVFSAADLEGGATLTTSTGLELVIADGQAGGVDIVRTDAVGSNGVIHVINGVLTPPAEPQLAVTGVSSELIGALGASFLVLGGAMVMANRRREQDDEELAA